MSKRYGLTDGKMPEYLSSIIEDGNPMKYDRLVGMLNNMQKAIDDAVAQAQRTVAALEAQLQAKEVALLEAKIESALNVGTASRLAIRDYCARLAVANAACEGDEPKEGE